MRKVILIATVVISFLFFYPEIMALNNVEIENHVISPRFSKDIKKYNIFLEEGENKLVFKCTLEENEEVNNCIEHEITSEMQEIILTSSIGNEEYIFKVFNPSYKVLEQALLKRLTIEGYEIDFDKDRFDYEITIEDETSLNIDFETLSSVSKTVFEGNENLNSAKNIITIKVITSDNKYENNYTITVNKAKAVFNNLNNVKSKSNYNWIYIFIIIIVNVLIFSYAFYFMFIKNKIKYNMNN